MEEKLEYHVPNEIMRSISPEFARALWNALREKFHRRDTSILDFYIGTYGWTDVFKEVCETQNREDLHEYADNLEWDEWDAFSHEIAEECLKQLGDNEGGNRSD